MPCRSRGDDRGSLWAVRGLAGASGPAAGLLQASLLPRADFLPIATHAAQVMEREKQRHLNGAPRRVATPPPPPRLVPADAPQPPVPAGQTISHIKQVPGWSERLASDSEAVVKAEHEVRLVQVWHLAASVGGAAADAMRAQGCLRASYHCGCAMATQRTCGTCCALPPSSPPAACLTSLPPCAPCPPVSAPTAQWRRCSGRRSKRSRWGDWGWSVALAGSERTLLGVRDSEHALPGAARAAHRGERAPARWARLQAQAEADAVAASPAGSAGHAALAFEPGQPPVTSTAELHRLNAEAVEALPPRLRRDVQPEAGVSVPSLPSHSAGSASPSKIATEPVPKSGCLPCLCGAGGGGR